MIERKKKICIQCKKDKYIWAYGRCKECDRLVNSALKKQKKVADKETVSWLTDELDRVFSIFIRKRGAIDGINQCFTCEKFLPIKRLQCGHYYSRGVKSLRWSEMNCHPQCVHCNVTLKGNYIIYTEKMQQKYSVEELRELKITRHMTRKFTRFELRTMIQYYSNKIVT